MKEIELIGKRKAREKHFLKQNGVIEAQVFDEDIHFLKNGIYEEIDNTLINKGDYYTNKNNAYEVKLYKDTSDNLMEVSIDDKFIKTRLLNPNLSELTENIMESKTRKNVCYSNILDNIDLEYNILPTKVKEAIILKNKNVCVEKLVFSIETNMKLSLLENKKIIAERDGVQIFEFDAPYMIDNEFKTNNNVSYELTECDSDEYLLKIKIDEEWLQDENTKCPVMIDPTITNSGQNNSVYDTYIYPGDTNIDRNSQDILKVGVERVNGVDIINRSLIKFELPTIGTGSQIISASIDIYGYPETPYNYKTDWLTVHQIISQWDEATANWNTMSDKYNPLVEAIIEASRGYYDYENQTIHPSYCGADITRLVRKWYTGTPNNGLMLKQNEEKYNPNILPAFYSKNNSGNGGNPKPVLSVSYRNQNGIEEYMNYQTQNFSIGRSYVNNYNGNLTSIFNVGKTIGGKMPVELNLVYNTNDVVLNNDVGYGLGYKLDLHQTIKEQPIDDKTYLEYNDEDGTLHYFLNQQVNFESSGYNIIDTGNVYYDEDGLNITITKYSDYYILKDKNGNTMKFIKNDGIAYLSEIEDVSGNKIIISYNENNRIVKIVDPNNSEINILYENNMISVISPDGTVLLNYLNNQIININSILGTTYFDYNENKISSIIGINGIKVLYEYYSEKPYKVKKISEYGTGNILGETFDILYNFDSTSIIDSKGKVKNMIFNSQGSLVSVSSMKDKDDINNAYGISQINGTSSLGENQGSNNKLLKTEIPLKYVKNFLLNTSFESDTNYFVGSSYTDTIISDETSNTGLKSLKIVSHTQNNQIVYYNGGLDLLKDKHYTFSCYIKNDNKLRLKLSYSDKNNQDVEVQSDIINPSNEFERHDVTIYFPEDAVGKLSVKLNLLETGTTYVDDIQLEEGEVANNYNLIENSDFSNGLSDWILNAQNSQTGEDLSTNDKFEIVTFDNGVKALKTKLNPVYVSSMQKTFNINGKSGDTYNISFWYKNQGIASNLSMHYGSRVYIIFKYVDSEENGECVLPTPLLNINDEAWQYVSNSFVAERDYTSITLLISHENTANDFYITNMNLFKDIRNVYYEYDKNGNIILENNLGNKNSEFNYDKNNQLIKMINPKGKNFMFEYDNSITDRVINGISDMGISNKFKYDENHNPILTKIINNIKSEGITDGLYQIRLKGTNEYLINISNEIKLKSRDYNNDLWKIEKSGEYFKIYHSILNNNYFTIKNNNIVLSTEDGDNSLFQLNKNKNGSYSIKLKSEDKYLKYDNQNIIISTYEEDDYHFEFYFETSDMSLFIENRAEYTNDGKFIKNTIDSLDNLTIYDFDTNGLENYTIDSNGHCINYNYNDKKQLISINEGQKEIECKYNDKNLLSEVKQGTRKYSIEYDSFSNLKSVVVGNNTKLATKSYDSIGKNVTSILYGNGDLINYEYDEFNRISKIIRNEASYKYKYNNVGDLVKIISDDHTVKYNYDLSKRLNEFIFDNFKIKYKYDINDDILQTKYKYDENILEIDNEYNSDEQVIKSSFENNEIKYEYDYLGRIIEVKINDGFKYNYKYITNGKKTSLIVKSIVVNNTEYIYKYDKLYNITTVYINGNLAKKYYYDELEELTREIDYINNQIIEYDYNKYGNIISKKIYNLDDYILIKKEKFEYDNSEWPDQLTKFNDNQIIYDSIGNPIKIADINLTWQNGRQLSTYCDSQKNISYEYNEDGLRIVKNINNSVIKYYFEGIDLVVEKTDDYVIYFIRSVDDKLIGFKYNNNIYYYIRNMQDDVISIVDSNYNIVVNYSYDSWGNILSITDSEGNDISKDSLHIGNINPFRYRSYYYDKDTNLYYLNSRYYSPTIGRFINADNYLSNDYRVLSSNMYIYCNNNYINEIDPSGHFSLGAFVVSGIIALGIFIAGKTKKKKKQAIKKIEKNQKKRKNVKDKTKQINQKLEKTKKEIQKETKGKNFVQKLQIIREKANDGAEYDLKLQDEWKETVIYNGYVMEAQDVGNFHFGYMGRAAGIPLEVLKLGAGYNQYEKYTIDTLDNCLTESYCDDMRDTFYITLGAMKYDTEN